MQHYEEIQHDQIQQYATELRAALEAVCMSPPFRSSPKGCEFLRHIVHHTLNSSVDELKERLIGMALLGRDASYDTSADAGVRVRANDVRKRLATYNSLESKKTDFVFELPAGTYVPRFFREVPEEVVVIEPTIIPIPPDTSLPLSMHRLAAPTLVVLFLCTMCLRWQLAQEQPFQTFWQGMFQGHRVMLYLPRAQGENGQALLSSRELNASLPLFNLAGQFHSQVSLADSPTAPNSSHDVLVSIGIPLNEHRATVEPSTAAQDMSLAIKDTPGGRQLFGHDDQNSQALHYKSAALLTIANGPLRSIRIDGTDQAAIQSLVEQLCERDSFPEGLTDNPQDGSLTQIVFPMAPHAERTVFHETLPKTQAGSGRP